LGHQFQHLIGIRFIPVPLPCADDVNCHTGFLRHHYVLLQRSVARVIFPVAENHQRPRHVRYIGIGSIGCEGSSGGQGVRDRVQLRLGLLRSLKRDCGEIHINLIGNNTRLL
jgi:hypothetical protein